MMNKKMEAVSQAHIKLTLPDGSAREVSPGITGADFAETIGKGLAKAALAIELDGRVRDLSAPIHDSAKVRILTFKDPEGRAVYRHSTAHVMAQAVMDIVPGAARCGRLGRRTVLLRFPGSQSIGAEKSRRSRSG
jgi:threonyl-tRNA synthetase